MPESLNNYVLQERPILPAIDLGIVQNTLSTITAGNKKALQTQSALRTAIANMDLNEAEDGFRQGLYDDITKTIEDNSIKGNAYYALDDIIKKQGDIVSNPALLGRLKAQQAYKTYQNQIDARTDIDQDIKDWAKELNPYSYQDKVDENGRIIGGTEWTPNFTPTSALDMNKIYAIASKYIIPEKGSINGSTFVDPTTGKTSTTYQPGMELLNQTTGSYERVTPKMVRNAIDIALQANPEYMAQMRQAYDVAKWKHTKEPNIPNPAYNGTRELSFTEYENNLIDPFINSQVRNTRIAHTNWHTAAKQTSNKSGGTSINMTSGIRGFGGDELFNYINSGRSIAGFSINLPTRYLDASVSNVFQRGRELAGILNIPITKLPETFDEFMIASRGKPEYNMDFDKTWHMPTAREAIEANLTRGLSEDDQAFLGINPNINRIRPVDNSWVIRYPNAIKFDSEQFANIKNFYDMYGSELSMFKSPQTFTDEGVIDFVQSVISTSSGIDTLDVTDPRIKKYNDLYGNVLNSLFDGDDSVTYTYKGNIDTSDKKRLSALGIQVTGNKLTLAKDNPDGAYAFVDFVNNHLNGDFEPSERERATIAKENEIMASTGGNYVGEVGGMRMGENISGHPNGYITRIAPYNNFFTTLAADKQNIRVNEVNSGNIDEDPTVLLNTSTLNGLSITDFVGNTILEMTGDSKVKTMANTAAVDILNLAKSGNIIDRDVFIVTKDENGDLIYNKATRDQKLRIRNELGTLSLNDVTGNLTYIDGFQFRPGITYSRQNYINEETQSGTTKFTKDPEKETVNIILGDGIVDPELNKLNNDNYLQIGTELTSSWVNGGQITIGKLGSQPITVKGATPPSSNNYTGSFDLYMGNDKIRTIDTPTAINGTIAYRMMINDRASLPFTDNDDENSELIGKYFAQNPDIYNAMLNLYGDEDSVLQIATDIFTK